MKHRSRKPALAAAIVASIVSLSASASSHREAPYITSMPKVDATDFYMFRSYESGRQGFVTLIANYIPLQDAYGGPNYFTFDQSARYRINIENDGDGVEDIVFEFRATDFLNDQPISVDGVPVSTSLRTNRPIPTANQNGAANHFQFGRLSMTTDAGTVHGTVQGNPAFNFPLDNIGDKTFSDYGAYANKFIHDIDIPGCGTGRVFVGQRKESFAVNLGETFDLVNLNPLGEVDGKPSVLEDKNVSTLALEVPISCVQGPGPVIGGWTTAHLPRIREISTTPTLTNPETGSGGFVQVSRLGMPLVNEVVIGLPDKDLFNTSHPSNDLANFATYVVNPTLPELLEILFGVQAPNNFPRGDLVAAFVTGITGVNDLGVGEMQRLNLTIPPVESAMQNNLGVIGGDLAGFPNGRRPGDDVVDVSLRVAMGVLCHANLGLCDPADAPSGTLEYTDEALQHPSQFDSVFPYLTTPLSGSPITP